MSYLLWDETYQKILDQWVVDISMNLIAQKRYEDTAILMTCLNDFSMIGCAAQSSLELNNVANDWMAMTISELASNLNDHNYEWNDALINQRIFDALQKISDFIAVNQLSYSSEESIEFPQILTIPDVGPPRLTFNF